MRKQQQSMEITIWDTSWAKATKSKQKESQLLNEKNTLERTTHAPKHTSEREKISTQNVNTCNCIIQFQFIIHNCSREPLIFFVLLLLGHWVCFFCVLLVLYLLFLSWLEIASVWIILPSSSLSSFISSISLPM